MDNEETGGAGGAPDPVAPVESTPPAPTGETQNQPQYVTAEQLQESLAPLHQISKFFQENFVEEEPQVDYSQIPPEHLAYMYAQQGTQGALAPYQPMLQAAMEQQGRQVFDRLMDQHDQTLGMQVPRDLAQSFAESSAVMREAKGDPIKAVEIGAKKAAEYVKAERQRSIDEYKKSLRGPGQSMEPGVAGGATRSVEPARDYEEVIQRWAGQDEV